SSLQDVFSKKMDCRVISAFTRVFNALCPAMTSSGRRCRHLPPGRRRDFFDVPPNGLVAFAGSPLEAAPVHAFDVPAVIAGAAGRLYDIGDHGPGRGAPAGHLR